MNHAGCQTGELLRTPCRELRGIPLPRTPLNRGGAGGGSGGGSLMGTMAKDLTQPVLAISGATGAVGGRIASRLAGLGHAQRLLVRDATRASDLPGAELAEGSYEDPEA